MDEWDIEKRRAERKPPKRLLEKYLDPILNACVELKIGVSVSCSRWRTNSACDRRSCRPIASSFTLSSPRPEQSRTTKQRPFRSDEFDVEKAWRYGECVSREGEAPAEPETGMRKRDPQPTATGASRKLPFSDNSTSTVGSAGASPSQSIASTYRIDFTHRVGSPLAWRASIEQNQANGDTLEMKNPHDSSEDHADPDELLAEYQMLMTELQQTRDRLKDESFQALEGTSSSPV